MITILPLLPKAATVHGPGSASALLTTTSTPFQELSYLIFQPIDTLSLKLLPTVSQLTGAACPCPTAP